jgi:hypothetical protein
VSSFSLVCFSWEFFVSSLRFRFFSLFKQRDVCAMLNLKHVFVLSGFKSHMINEKSGGDSLPPLQKKKLCFFFGDSYMRGARSVRAWMISSNLKIRRLCFR